MLTMEKLQAYGAKTDEGLKRCLGNEGMYLRLIGMAVEDGNFAKLEEAIRSGDVDSAFNAAHALKGALGNLALEPLFAPVSELTELLRRKTPGNCEGLLKTVLEQRAALRKLTED